MDNILNQAKKVAEEADVFMVSSEETPVHFEANRLKYIQSKQSSSVTLRIIRDGKIGCANMTESGDSQELVEMAAETAQFGMAAKFEFPSLKSYPMIEIFDPDIESVTTEEMVKLGQELIDIIRKHTPDLLCEAEVTKGVTTIRIINSRWGGRIQTQFLQYGC